MTRTRVETPSLFSKDVMESLITTSERIIKAEGSNGLGTLNHKLCENLSFTGNFQIPVVEAINCPPPKSIAALYRLKHHAVSSNSIPHFFTPDVHFESTWSHPRKTLETLFHFDMVISPDFSVYNELVYPQKVWNIFRNKLLAAWWQYNGILVIPNVSWLIGFDYAISFDGWPRNSVIAVNSTGVGKDPYCRHAWLMGYKEMLRRLSPLHIIRYGAKIAGECEEISTYYPNDNQIFARYGRK